MVSDAHRQMFEGPGLGPLAGQVFYSPVLLHSEAMHIFKQPHHCSHSIAWAYTNPGGVGQPLAVASACNQDTWQTGDGRGYCKHHPGECFVLLLFSSVLRIEPHTSHIPDKGFTTEPYLLPFTFFVCLLYFEMSSC